MFGSTISGGVGLGVGDFVGCVVWWLIEVLDVEFVLLSLLLSLLLLLVEGFVEDIEGFLLDVDTNLSVMSLLVIMLSDRVKRKM